MSAALLRLGLVLASPSVRKAVAVVCGILAVLVAVRVSYSLGARKGATEAHQQDAVANAAALAKVEALYRAKELVYVKQVEAQRIQYAKQQATEFATDTRITGDLNSGTQRVRIKVARCDPGPASARPAPTRIDDTSTAELAPSVAAALYTIAADGDKAIRQLTALQAWAKSAVILCGGANARLGNTGR